MGSYNVPKGCVTVSHLAFADDFIIFTNGSKANLHKLMDFLAHYQISSG